MSGWNKNNLTLQQHKRGNREIDIMTRGKIIIAIKRGRDVMTLREKCIASKTEIIVSKEWREIERDEGIREVEQR